MSGDNQVVVNISTDSQCTPAGWRRWGVLRVGGAGGYSTSLFFITNPAAIIILVAKIPPSVGGRAAHWRLSQNDATLRGPSVCPFLSVHPSKLVTVPPWSDFWAITWYSRDFFFLQNVAFICRLAAAANGAISHPAFEPGGGIFTAFETLLDGRINK